MAILKKKYSLPKNFSKGDSLCRRTLRAKRLNQFWIFLTGCTLLFSFQKWSAKPALPDASADAGQVIVVVTEGWNSITAKLYGFQKQKDLWQLKFSFPAVVGQNGLAWGTNEWPEYRNEGPLKKEGDLRSPAGLFLLGPAFGYAGAPEAKWIHLPYIQASDTLICVDDPNSGLYNKLIRKGSAKSDWGSHEEMHRKDDDYQWGIFVQYNSHPVKPGQGSCIFLHIWEGADQGTAGCTAIEKKNMLTLLHWIRTDQQPLLIQFPVEVYKKIRKKYALPEL